MVYEQEIIHSGPIQVQVWRQGDHELHSPSLFPYAIAAVCSFWRDVMALVPEFWTRLVILVDSTLVPPISVIRSHVSWSGDLLLQIMVTRIDYDRQLVDVQHERAQVMSIMNAVLNPSMHRLRGLRFDVMFSSSLPQFPDGFATNSITDLKLICREDNGRSLDFWESLTPPVPDQQYHSLHTLCIDGRNYYNNCRTSFWRTAEFMALKVLIIANYTPLPGESFTSSDFVFPITTLNIESLSIINVILTPSPTPLPTTSSGRTLCELDFFGIQTFETMAGIIGGLGQPDICFTFNRSNIGDFRIPIGGESSGLSLIHIDEDQNMIPLLRCWQGSYVKIFSCDGFDDAVLLDMMASDDAENGCAAGKMKILDIFNSYNFSGALLRRLVHARRHVGRELACICITGFAPEISSEDQQWLFQNLDRFHYEPSFESSSSRASSSGSTSPI
jgi:hypothetical protein